MKRYNEQTINVYAGRPGAGKTHWARKEINGILIDPNNMVVYIGHSEMNAKLAEDAEHLPGKLYMSDDTHTAQAIGVAIDAANMDRAVFSEHDESENAQRNHRQVFIFFDQCRQLISNGHRDLLVAAAKQYGETTSWTFAIILSSALLHRLQRPHQSVPRVSLVGFPRTAGFSRVDMVAIPKRPGKSSVSSNR